MKIAGSYRKESAALKAIESALRTYYSKSLELGHTWRFDRAMEEAKATIARGEAYYHEGAQWGGKWGNFLWAVGLNEKGKYVFATGFTNEIAKNLANA